MFPMQLPTSDLYPSVPIVTGASGLTGRPPVRPFEADPTEPIGFDDETGEPIFAQEPAPGPGLPSLCFRLLSLPRPEMVGGCPPECPGRQRDGGCLCDIVREANAAGEEWAFEIDAEGFWVRKD